MKTIIIKATRLSFITFCCFIPLQVLSADALNQADTNAQEQNRQQERLRLLQQQQEIKPDAREASEKLKDAAQVVIDQIPESETPCFTIHSIELIGDTANKFQFALDAVLADAHAVNQPILGRCLGAIGINAVMAKIQHAIIAKGYVTTRVLATPQDLKSGVLQLTIVPGRLGAVRFTPDSSKRVTAWNIVPINSGDILNLRDIEQSLENFKRVPTAEADIQIEPAQPNSSQAGSNQALEAQPGLSDLLVRYQQRFPFRIALSLDDSGVNSTGKYQGGITLSGDNLLALSDLFYINYNHDLGGGDSGRRGNESHSAHYSVPYKNWLFSTNASHSTFHQTVAGTNQSYVFSGISQQGDIKATRLLYRNQINKTFISLKGFLRKSSNYIDDTEIEVQRRRTAGWELGLNQSWYLGSAILDYNLAYRRGTGAKNSKKAPEEAFDEGSSRMEMLIGDLSFSIPFKVNAPWGTQALQYSVHLRGQANYTPLTPQDRFSIGNRFTVRGFDGQQTLLADHGWFIRNELVVPIAASGQSMYWGLDYGEVGGQSAKNLLGQYLAGTALGMRGGLGSRFGTFSYDVFVAKPINKPQGFETHSTTAGFNFNYAY